MLDLLEGGGGRVLGHQVGRHAAGGAPPEGGEEGKILPQHT